MEITESNPVEILLVEDSPSDVRLTREALERDKLYVNLNVVNNGEEALSYLSDEGEYEGRPRPDLILLDLNLPKLSGQDVLKQIKTNEHFKSIPVVVLTSSEAPEDVEEVYELNANCYVTKPLDLDQFHNVVRTIEDFWLTIVKLPGERGEG